MTRDVLYAVVQESVWERARALSDFEAAQVLADYFVSDLFPAVPEHELFTVPNIVREIAYLSPPAGQLCLDAVSRSPRFSRQRVEVGEHEFMDWSRFTEMVERSVDAGSRARLLGTGSESDRVLQRKHALEHPSGSEARLWQESIYLLAESLHNASAAQQFVSTWWRSPSRLPDGLVLTEILVRLWYQNPEAAVL